MKTHNSLRCLRAHAPPQRASHHLGLFKVAGTAAKPLPAHVTTHRPHARSRALRHGPAQLPLLLPGRGEAAHTTTAEKNKKNLKPTKTTPADTKNKEEEKYDIFYSPLLIAPINSPAQTPYQSNAIGRLMRRGPVSGGSRAGRTTVPLLAIHGHEMKFITATGIPNQKIQLRKKKRARLSTVPHWWTGQTTPFRPHFFCDGFFYGPAT